MTHLQITADTVFISKVRRGCSAQPVVYVVPNAPVGMETIL